MNGLKKALIFTVLSLVFLFAFKGEQSASDEIMQKKSSSSFSTDSIHTSAFIQPQVTPTFLLNYKTVDHIIAKRFEHFLVLIPDCKTLKPLNTFLTQDINRCENVSLLLFPFHFFW